MASKERKVRWSEEAGVLLLTNVKNSNDYFSCDLRNLFPTYDSMTESQKYIIEFGVKQSLSDDYASVEEAELKVRTAEVGWKELLSGEKAPRKRRDRTLEDFENAVEKAQTRVAECESYVANWATLTDDDKRTAAKFGRNLSVLTKDLVNAQKALAKAEKNLKDEMEK